MSECVCVFCCCRYNEHCNNIFLFVFVACCCNCFCRCDTVESNVRADAARQTSNRVSMFAIASASVSLQLRDTLDGHERTRALASARLLRRRAHRSTARSRSSRCRCLVRCISSSKQPSLFLVHYARPQCRLRFATRQIRRLPRQILHLFPQFRAHVRPVRSYHSLAIHLRALVGVREPQRRVHETPKDRIDCVRASQRLRFWHR